LKRHIGSIATDDLWREFVSVAPSWPNGSCPGDVNGNYVRLIGSTPAPVGRSLRPQQLAGSSVGVLAL